MFGLQIDRTLPGSIATQLTEQLRHRILKGELKRGERLPSSRYLATELNIARNIIIQVYEQLQAEGYLESHVGSGTFVAGIREYNLTPAQYPPGGLPEKSVTSDQDMVCFHAGNPDSDLFPRNQWAKLYKEACLDSGGAFEYGPIAGERSLRSGLRDYLFRVKGIQCLPEQIFIVPGASRGIELIAKVLVSGEMGAAVIEDPSLDYIQNIVRHNGLKLLPVPVDQDGIQTDNLPENASVRLVYVVPSHQFPMGGVLPIDRRLQLLDYVNRKGAYVIEDDYDSEFRYQGEPIQSLRHLDSDRVIYLGTFSKILSPGLRLGYVIMPHHLYAKALEIMEQLNLRTSSLEQQTMARFLNQRFLERHVFRMKRIYAAKRAVLIAALKHEFGNKMAITGTNAGLHVLVTYCSDFCQGDLERFGKAGVEVDWVEDYAVVKGQHRNQLVLGYGNLSLEQIRLGVQRIKRVLEPE